MWVRGGSWGTISVTTIESMYRPRVWWRAASPPPDAGRVLGWLTRQTRWESSRLCDIMRRAGSDAVRQKPATQGRDVPTWPHVIWPAPPQSMKKDSARPDVSVSYLRWMTATSSGKMQSSETDPLWLNFPRKKCKIKQIWVASQGMVWYNSMLQSITKLLSCRPAPHKDQKYTRNTAIMITIWHMMRATSGNILYRGEDKIL